jgi:capsular exopolysaccharide synthesis family protein
MMGVLAPAQGRRALSIISPDVGDGKTFIAANLAVAFSQLRGRTLIVDADMRNPRLHEVFNIENNIGLSSILSGRTQGNVIRQIAELPNLYFLPVGAVPPNPSELVQQAGFDLLIQELMNKFDNVLVDTPAASHGSDARMIAAKCGAALIVSRKDKTHSATLQKLMSQLAKGPTLVAGVMFNVY